MITAQTTGSAVDAKLDLLLPASSTGNARVRFKQGDSSGDANNMMYQLYYEASSDYLVLRSADSDGGSTAAGARRRISGGFPMARRASTPILPGTLTSSTAMTTQWCCRLTDKA